MMALMVVDNTKRWPLKVPGMELVTSRDYISDPRFAAMPSARVFNLCRSYRYQAAGYYVSLLAAARGHRAIPSVETIQDMKLSPIVRIASEELDELIQRTLRPLKSDEFELSIYFGRNLTEKYDKLALAIFNQFPAPLLRASFRRDSEWGISALRVIGAADLPDEHRPFVVEQAQRYLTRPSRKPRAKQQARFDMAILRDPTEAMSPSNDKAIRLFTEAAEELGIAAEEITKDDYGRIGEFDALFIRETTNVNHHTYRFSRRAAAAGLVVIDDPESIVRCTNKVYLAELMERHKLPTPKTLIFSQETMAQVGERIGFPCVIKQPDSSFSAGVAKIESERDFAVKVEPLFEKSDLLLAQEFVPTDFDWRVGVLDGEPLFVCKYFMAEDHWQIIHREADRLDQGRFETMPLQKCAPGIISLAVRAAKLIGRGLYGVDIKILGGRPKIIEVNDNPSIDAGVEDQVIGDLLYQQVMQHFLTRLETRHVPD
jgi:glutathione synthase/RimK-type ligase-like ATP-grasp enzyme